MAHHGNCVDRPPFHSPSCSAYHIIPHVSCVFFFFQFLFTEIELFLRSCEQVWKRVLATQMFSCSFSSLCTLSLDDVPCFSYFSEIIQHLPPYSLNHSHIFRESSRAHNHNYVFLPHHSNNCNKLKRKISDLRRRRNRMLQNTLLLKKQIHGHVIKIKS